MLNTAFPGPSFNRWAWLVDGKTGWFFRSIGIYEYPGKRITRLISFFWVLFPKRRFSYAISYAFFFFFAAIWTSLYASAFQALFFSQSSTAIKEPNLCWIDNHSPTTNLLRPPNLAKSLDSFNRPYSLKLHFFFCPFGCGSLDLVAKSVALVRHYTL